MAEAIVVLNAGSSSLKFSLFARRDGGLESVVRGNVDGLYTAPRFSAKGPSGTLLEEHAWGKGERLGHDGALEHVVAFLRASFAEHRLCGVGHRVVHGGLHYTQPVRVDETVLDALDLRQFVTHRAAIYLRIPRLG